MTRLGNNSPSTLYVEECFLLKAKWDRKQPSIDGNSIPA